MIKFNFRGQRVIVTGGSMGLGKSIVEEFSRAGATVLIADLNLEEAKKAKKSLSKHPGKILVCQTDVSNYEDVEAMIEYAKDEMGGVDILVNNAGICECLPLISQDVRKIDQIIKVNLNGTLYGCRAVLPVMQQQGKGKIINMSSIAAKMGGAGAATYSATKAGVLELTACLAREYAKENITVNCICPGIIRTPLWEKMLDEFTAGDISKKDDVFASFTKDIPMGRPQEPVDIANAVLFLCSSEADNITAQNLGVDGGQTY